jgi:transcriptional regulator with PAS, ATPase and Fis domain
MGLYVGKREVPPLTHRMMEKLHRYNWPGNVRELQNVIVRYCNQRKIDLTGATVARNEAPSERVAFSEPVQPGAIDLQAMLAKYEKLLILNTLNQYQWHRQKTAQALNVDRKTLFNKMQRHGLTP